MNRTMQCLIVGLLVVVAGLQVTVLAKINSMQPESTNRKREEPRIPSLDEIDGRIRHWTMHFGQHFSAQPRVYDLKSQLVTRLREIEKKLDVLSEERK